MCVCVCVCVCVCTLVKKLEIHCFPKVLYQLE